MSAAPAQRHRTFFIILLAILAVIAGIMSLFDAARYMGWLPVETFGELKMVLPNYHLFYALMAAAVGVIWFVVASWVWNLNPSGWLFLVLISIFNLIFLFLAVIGKTEFNQVIWQILVNAAVLLICLLPNTKQQFIPPLPTADQLKGARDAAVAAGAAKAPVAKPPAAAAPAPAAKPAAPSAAAVAPAPAAPVQKVDLTKVKGIGPEVQKALNDAGINTYGDLVKASPEQLQAIMTDAGIISDVSTWSAQASLAAAGNWSELDKMQQDM
jgi:predicted flap endonuclease-1-like 5' DNA nuclease